MLVAYTVSLDLARSLQPIIVHIKTHSRDLADQLERAASSVVLNISEGDRRSGGDRRRLFTYAHGSAAEVRGALDLALIWGWAADVPAARAILDRLLGLLWGLTR